MQTAQRDFAEARAEAEHHRYEAEELRRQEVEREMERVRDERRRRDQERRNLMPSNRLYNGEVSDFREAVKLHIAACQQELELPWPDDDEALSKEIDDKCNQALRDSVARAQQASAVYNRIMRSAEAEVLKALKSEGLEDWAECFETADYSTLAI